MATFEVGKVVAGTYVSSKYFRYSSRNTEKNIYSNILTVLNGKCVKILCGGKGQSLISRVELILPIFQNIKGEENLFMILILQV